MVRPNFTSFPGANRPVFLDSRRAKPSKPLSPVMSIILSSQAQYTHSGHRVRRRWSHEKDRRFEQHRFPKCLQCMDPYIYRAGRYLTNPCSIAACRFHSDHGRVFGAFAHHQVRSTRTGEETLGSLFHASRSMSLRFLDFFFADLRVADFFYSSLHVFVPNEVMGPVVVFEAVEGVCTGVSSVFGPLCFPPIIHNPNPPRLYL
jgi:hypothetical protein